MLEARIAALGIVIGLMFALSPTMAFAKTSTNGYLWGAEPRHIDSVFGILQKTGSRQGYEVFGNTSFTDSSVDIRQYLSHKCFILSGNEITQCTTEFGPFADLQKTLLDGALTELVRSYYPDKENLRSLLMEVRKKQREIKNAKVKVITNTDIQRSELQVNRLDRRQAVWNICKKKYVNNIRGATACFIRNHRITTNLSIPLSENQIY